MYPNNSEESVSYKNNLHYRIMNNTTSDCYPSHWHTALELIMPVENNYTVEIAQHTITLSPFDILLIPSGELHTLTAPPAGSRLILQIDYSMLAGYEEFPALLYRFHPFLYICAERQPGLHTELSSLLSSLSEEYFSQRPLKEVSVYASLLHFFILLGRSLLESEDSLSFPDTSIQKQREYTNKFRNVLSYINAHCTENPEVSHLADMAGFSVSHFTRLFRQYTSMSWYCYLNRQKIQYAERLLASTGLSVTEIAMQSGFNSLATFNRIFKAEKHCTPSEYKKKYRF